MEEYKVKDTESLKRKLKDKNIRFEVLEDYKKSQTKILFNKLDCDHEPFYATPNNILKGTYNCPKCAKINRRETKRRNSHNTIESYEKELNELMPGFYKVVPGQKFLNNKKNIQLECNECGNIFGLSLVNMRQYRGCPKCASYKSNGVKFIEKFLNENGIEFEREAWFEDCKNTKPLKFDFKIFINGGFKMLEFDGTQHENGYNGNKKSKEYVKIIDQIKNQYCEDNNIELLRIKSKETKNINEILKNYLKK